ncbi:HAMP domain-containing sensor histidine kinase [Paenibacillus caui]|uniref:HAMP domain-containing sensor histidine kinase n=1 Tax=Paenibacillus caui TaxID=2873927 RepID=UPI001CA7D14A|nr:HAMP domain-containing sensor histidine kinase [Paenibacillus caui]
MGRIRRIFGNLSIKKTFMLYMLLFLLIAALFSLTTINLADVIQNRVKLSYADAKKQIAVGEGGVILEIRNEEIPYTAKDWTLIQICDFIQTWSIPIFFGSCIVLSSLLFYRNKLKKPIEILSGASEKIAANDLDFHIVYDSRDEMGQLCSSFEKMRSSLEANYRDMWRSMEERKRLNAAFSHDLRTPLTVLRGYADFLMRYMPQDKIPKDKLVSTMSTMSGHILRLQNYVDSMNTLQKLEDFHMTPKPVDIPSFSLQLKQSAEILAQKQNIAIDLVNHVPQQEICLDPEVAAQVFENLISNAVRYAKSRIRITCSMDADGRFRISVFDDGSGFSAEALHKAASPYYKGEERSDETHFGLGLNICQILCEKHGGELIWANGPHGGAEITASFMAARKSEDC